MAQLKTRSGKLSELARHIVLPTGIETTGWPAVREKCEEFGDSFDEWQDGAGRAILAKRGDGMYAATVGGVSLSIPRQVAKTFLVGRIVVALCILFPGLTVLWTAHHNRTLTRTFRSIQGFVKRKKVAPYLAADGGIRTANGEQEIKFRNGSIIMFGAREQGFGRGFEEVDIEVFDEAQILTEKALEDMVAATNQTRHPHGALLFYMGTPPRPEDNGEAFTLRRQKALSGKSTEALYIEFSADPGADPDDREQWAKANPSFPHRTPLESMLRLRENLMSDEAWLREALGIWDAPGASSVIPAEAWQVAGDEGSTATGRVALGIEVAPDLVGAAVALAGQRDDGLWHVELNERRDGVEWLVPYVDALVAMYPHIRALVADAGSPIATLSDEFERAGLRLNLPKVAELGQGCARVYDGVMSGWLRHLAQPQLSVSVSVAGKRNLSDTGMWVWSRKSSTADITPIQAATLALIGAQADKTIGTKRIVKPQRGGGKREAVVL